MREVVVLNSNYALCEVALNKAASICVYQCSSVVAFWGGGRVGILNQGYDEPDDDDGDKGRYVQAAQVGQ